MRELPPLPQAVVPEPKIAEHRLDIRVKPVAPPVGSGVLHEGLPGGRCHQTEDEKEEQERLFFAQNALLLKSC